MTKPGMVKLAGRLGAVEEYGLARLSPEPGRHVTCSAVFEDYRAWCDREGLAPFREAEFIAAFESLARAAGIRIRQRGGNLSFLDTALRDVATG